MATSADKLEDMIVRAAETTAANVRAAKEGIGAVIFGVSQEDIAAYGRKRGTEDYKWRACLIPCRLVFEKGNHPIPVTGGFLRKECQKLFSYRTE